MPADDGTVLICLSGAALDAWWDTLSVGAKAEALSDHYEAAAAEPSPVGTSFTPDELNRRRMREV